MDPKDLETIANQWISFFNERNLAGLLGLYEEEAIHESPSLKDRWPGSDGQIKGKASLRAWYQEAFRIHELKYEPLCFIVRGYEITMVYERRARGQPVRYVAESLEVNDFGKIVKSRVLLEVDFGLEAGRITTFLNEP